VNDGFHRMPLVPGRLKALQYVLPCAVGPAQCHVSNEVNSLGCAAQYDWRPRADAQLRIDWKVRHSYLTPSCGPSSIHLSFQKRSNQQRSRSASLVRFSISAVHGLAAAAHLAALVKRLETQEQDKPLGAHRAAFSPFSLSMRWLRTCRSWPRFTHGDDTRLQF
jgi:hypothetical protein